jgi:hypothetical protein
VKVAEGYGRNFLLPRKLAIEANSANKAVIEQMKAASVRRSAMEKGEVRSARQAVPKDSRFRSSAAPVKTINSSAQSLRATSPRLSRRRAFTSIAARSSCMSL